MADNKETKWIPETGIMKPYLHLEPQYEVIYENEKKHDQKVVKVELKDSAKYVIKHLRIESKNKLEINELLREYRIANILGTVTNGITMSRNIEKKKVGEYTVIEILMDYGGTPLSTFIDRGELEKDDTMNIACQLLSTLTLMEELGVSHLDIKPLNIAWDKSKNRVKLIDFGTSLMSFGKDNKVFKELDNKKMKYTKKYAAPEIKEKGRKVIPQKLDVYSFALTLLSLLAAEYKMEDPISCEKNSLIKKFNIEELKKEVRKEDTNGLWEEIYKIIEETPESRPTFRELREVFLKQAKGMTEDDHLLKIIYSLDDHPIKIDLTQYMKLKDAYMSLIDLYDRMGNHDMLIKCVKKYLKVCSEFKGENDLEVGKMYCILSILYKFIYKEEEAITCFKKASSTLSKMDLKDEVSLKLLYGVVRSINSDLDHYKRADEYYNKFSRTKSGEYEDLYYMLIELIDYTDDYEKLEESYDKLFNEIKNVKDIYTATLCFVLGYVYIHKGNFKQANVALNEALNIVLNEYGEQCQFLILVYCLLGLSNALMGKFDQAIEVVDKGLSISSAIFGEMNVLTMLLNIVKSYSYCHKGYYERSIEMCNKSLNFLLHKFGSHNKHIMFSYMCLGRLYYCIGDFAKVKSHFLKALDIAENIFEKGHAAYIEIYEALGGLSYLYEDNPDKAINYLNGALNIKLKIFGEKHPSIPEMYSYLIFAYSSKRDYQEVIRLSEIFLGIRLKADRKKDLVLGTVYSLLGSSYCFVGNRELGISNLNKGLDIFLSIYPEQDLHIVDLYRVLGRMYESKHDYVRTLEMFDKASKIMTKLFEKSRPMAQVDQVKDNTNRAIESINKASKIPESTPVNENIYEFRHYSFLGELCYLKEDYSGAEAAYKQALKISLNIYGELHSETARHLSSLGTLYIVLKNNKEAEEYLNKALNTQLRTSAGTDFYTGYVYYLLSVIYQKTNRYKEALYALEKALNIFNSNPIHVMDSIPIMNENMQELCDIIERGD